MSDGDWGTNPTSLSLPPGAGPTDPHLVIGPDVPAALQTWVGANFLQHCYFAFLGYDVTGGYQFDAYCYSDAIQISQKISGYMTGANVAHLFNTSGWDLVGNTGGFTFGQNTTLRGEPVNVWSDWLVDGVSLGRGLRATVSAVVNSAGIGAEAVVLTSPNFTVFDQRAYKWKLLCHLVASVAGNNANTLIRDTNLAGAILGFSSVPCGAAGPFYLAGFEGYFKRVAGSSRVMNLVQTASASVGLTTVAGATTAVRSLEVYDIGAASNFPNAIAV